MNKKDIMAFLMQVFEYFDTDSRMIEELLELIAESGVEVKFLKLLRIRLKILSTYGIDAVKHEEFENLGGGLYSMHLSKTGFNIRILYAFYPDGMPSLLLCFYERGGKRKTDYSSYIPTARQRFEKKMEEYDHEHR